MTQYPFLRSNLEALERENPSAHQWLKERVSSHGPSESLVRNSRGLLDWMLPTGKGLFEALSPRTVYKNWRIPKDSELGLSVIIGCNLGYGLNHLLPKVPYGHQVLVLEPRPDLLFACLGYTDYRPFIETRRLVFLPPHRDQVRETMSRLVLPCLFGKIFLRCDLLSLQLGPEYALWANLCKKDLEDLSINIRTIRSKQEHLIVNEMRNLRRSRMEASPAGLKDTAEGTTGVILGAGPSLERFAPELVPYREGALFSTSFQALPALQGLGLKPHFAMAIDSSPSLLKVYDKLDEKWVRDIPLIYATTVFPEVVEKYPGATIPIWTNVGLACHIPSGKEPVLDVGGNVGVALMRFLRWCGVDRLLLVGQDFSWSGSNIHAGGSPSDGQGFGFDPRVHIKMRNSLGQQVFTAQPYVTALGELERDLEGTTFPVFDLYGGGLPIRGSKSIGLHDLPCQGLFGNGSAGVGKFVQTMRAGLFPAKSFFPEREISAWRVFLRSARQSLEVLLERPSTDRQRVVSFMDALLHDLQEDPLRSPYLTNEAIDLAGLIYKSRNYGVQELQECRSIIERAEKKMREMDRYLNQEIADWEHRKPGALEVGEAGCSIQ